MTSEAGARSRSYLPKDENSNAANCDITTLDSTNNIVFSENPAKIALLGVHNLIVVRTDDAILICQSAPGREDQEPGRQASVEFTVKKNA